VRKLLRRDLGTLEPLDEWRRDPPFPDLVAADASRQQKTELVESCEVDQNAAEVEEQNIESRSIFHE